MNLTRIGFIGACICVCTFTGVTQVSAEEVTEFDSLNLADLLNLEIVSASNMAEELSDAPATVLVITSEDISNRGYTDLMEIFSDIPGIDMSITFGDLYFRPYWRGFRKGSSSPFLFMVDGMVMNHLWFNWTDVMTAVPLSNIKQVEVVYGPASSVYGPNAMMGVINVVTKTDLKEDGLWSNVRLGAGGFNTRVADMTMLYKKGDFRVRVSGFLNHGDLDKESLEGHEWTKTEHLQDPDLWHNCLDNPHICGKVTSPRKNRALNLNLYLGGLEIGAQYYRVGDMYGTNYAYDKMQIQGIWVEEDYVLYLRNTAELTDDLVSHSLIRFRKSDVPNESNSIERWGDDQVHFGIWQALSDSWAIEQSFDFSPMENLLIKAGLKYDIRHFQKAYDLPYGEPLGEGQELTDSFYPDVPPAAYQSNNRVTWVDQGAYLQTRYNLRDLIDTEESHFLNFGLRYDKNNFFSKLPGADGEPAGGNWTLRAGYVGHLGGFTGKLLYGHAIQEPTARQLYGGWGGSGSDPNLQPERSQTVETYVGYVSETFGLAVNPYMNRLSNVIRELQDGGQNSGESTVFGLDVHANAVVSLGGGNDLKFWAFYSWLSAQEENYTRGVWKDPDPTDDDDTEIWTDQEVDGTREVGDLADHKVFFGVTGRMLERKLIMTLRGRFIGARNVVAGNPIGWRLESDDGNGTLSYDDVSDATYGGSLYEPCGEGDAAACPEGTGYSDGEVDAYITMDLSLVWKDFLSPFYREFEGVNVGLHIKNLLNTQYFHPGIRAANSGVTPGTRNDDGSWNGSRGWSNSLLPQPGRQILMSMEIEH